MGGVGQQFGYQGVLGALGAGPQGELGSAVDGAALVVGVATGVQEQVATGLDVGTLALFAAVAGV